MTILSTCAGALMAAAFTLTPPHPVERIARSRSPTRTHHSHVQGLGTATEMELFAACFTAGLPPAHAARAVATVTGDHQDNPWHIVAALLELGVDPASAWGYLAQHHGLNQLARLARSQAVTGAHIGDQLKDVAEQLRAEAADEQQGRAEKAGVLIAIPLALFFLPAFILLGLVPVVFSLASTMFQ